MNMLALREPDMDAEHLREQVASHYCDVLDETGKALRLVPLVKSFCENHPNYDEVQIVTLLKEDSEWDAYLQSRRRNHLINRTAASLLAAEMGGRLGVLALEEAQRRLEDEVAVSEIADKDIQGYIKLGMDLNAKVDKDLTEVTGDVNITMHLKDVIMGMPVDRAAAFMAEYGRMTVAPKNKEEIIDGSCDSE